MSEKVTLLTSIPPVKKTETAAPEPQETQGKVSLLSQTKADTNETVSAKSESTTAQSRVETISTLGTVSTTETQAVETQAVETQAVETQASEAVAEEVNSITGFQYLTYASFVLNFLFAGAAAVLLFKKASKLAEERFVASTKTLAFTGVLILLHGLFATYLYAAHLNDSLSSTPLFWTMAVWVLVGPAVGFITRNLLARQDKPNRNAAYVDAGIYGAIFLLTACGVSGVIKTNAALLASILAGFLMIVPIARSMSAFKVARARHKELNNVSNQILVYALLFIPALLPALAFANVCGLGDALTLFLINFITFDFLLIVSLAMFASADEAVEVAEPASEPAEAVTPSVVHAEAAAEPTKPEKVVTGNPNDPIIQFLNSEEAEGKVTTPEDSAKPAAKSKPSALPPRKPDSAWRTPPKKPGSRSQSSPAPNAPSRLKVPSKPKKRF